MPPGNRLEALKGDLTGFHSIRINSQWRVLFRWTDDGHSDVATHPLQRTKVSALLPALAVHPLA